MALPLSLPNIITIARILLVPLAIWLIINQQMLPAFLVFVVAGVSDAVDGWLAKRFDMRTELGAHLDPLADKLLLISIFVALAIMEYIPVWLTILVVTRDMLIVGGVVLAWIMERPMRMRPVRTSKANTAAQIAFAGLMLLFHGMGWKTTWLLWLGAPVVATLTVVSGAIYIRAWLRHMNEAEREGEAS